MYKGKYGLHVQEGYQLLVECRARNTAEAEVRLLAELPDEYMVWEVIICRLMLMEEDYWMPFHPYDMEHVKDDWHPVWKNRKDK